MADSKPEVREDTQRGELKDTPFENILNFRDVGKTINEFVGQKYDPGAGLETRLRATS
jgi:protein-tyrosine phosphatase